MKEHPILFKAEMVRAILEGRKTQTRRIVKPDANLKNRLYSFDHAYPGSVRAGHGYLFVPNRHADDPDWPWSEHGHHRLYCPHGEPGDRLWVKETWKPDPSWGYPQKTKPTEIAVGTNILYRATIGDHPKAEWQVWRPSLFMRRWMSRITLEIESIRVERLQEISEEDAIAEGIEEIPGESGMLRFRSYISDTPLRLLTAYESYRSLWVAINGPGSWDANPWVWVVTFKRANQ